MALLLAPPLMQHILTSQSAFFKLPSCHHWLRACWQGGCRLYSGPFSLEDAHKIFGDHFHSSPVGLIERCPGMVNGEWFGTCLNMTQMSNQQMTGSTWNEFPTTYFTATWVTQLMSACSFPPSLCLWILSSPYVCACMHLCPGLCALVCWLVTVCPCCRLVCPHVCSCMHVCPGLRALVCWLVCCLFEACDPCVPKPLCLLFFVFGVLLQCCWWWSSPIWCTCTLLPCWLFVMIPQVSSLLKY